MWSICWPKNRGPRATLECSSNVSNEADDPILSTGLGVENEVLQQKQKKGNLYLLYCTVSPRFSWYGNHPCRPDKPGRVMYTNTVKRVKHRVIFTQLQLLVTVTKRKDL